MTDIHIRQAQYVDPRAGNDKFYRTFVIGSAWVTQYGRNGTVGTFTKLVDAGSDAAAVKAAESKFSSKVKKGYQPVRTGTVTSTTDIDETNLVLLDDLAATLPADGSTPTVVTAPVNPVELTTAAEPDRTDAAAAALNALCAARPAAQEDLTPPLPVRPMLASVQPQDVLEMAMTSPSWIAQFKYDGDRVVVETIDGTLRVLNRQGQEKTRHVGAHHLQPFTALHTGRWVFDGEIVGRTLVLFDLAAASDGGSTWVDESTAFSQRHLALDALADVLGIPSASTEAPVVLAGIAVTEEAKDQMLATAVREQREGIILRHLEAPYESGRRSTTLIKHKLIKDADVVITALHPSKQSAVLSAHDASGQLIEVGAASTIGKGDVRVGDVWVVTFLYVTDPAFPRLVQPRLVARRDDKPAAECLLEQFADAGTNKIV